MACYTFTLGNKEFTIRNKNKNNDAADSMQFLQALQQLSASDPDTYEEIIKALGDLQKSPNARSLDARDNRDLPYILQMNLQTYGIRLNILKNTSTGSELSWSDFCAQHNINKDAKAFVFEGQIYVNGSDFEVGTAMHELTHLFLAVLKVKNFEQYRQLIHTLYQHSTAKNIASTLNSVPSYSNNSDLDFEEECVVRMFEQIYDRKDIPLDFVDSKGDTIDVLNFFDENLRSVIQETLGIQKYPGIITFMQSLISDIPTYQNAFLQKSRLSSTTNFNIEQVAKETAGISNLINFLSQDNLPNELAEEKIEKGECK